MRKNLFISKNSYKKYTLILVILILVSLFCSSIYLNINKKYFIINETNKNLVYFVIPKDKEGEKVRFLNKKSINNKVLDKKNTINEGLNYTIQLYSSTEYKQIEKYIQNLINNKNEIISSDDIFIISLNSQIGIDYFVTYKNFNSENNAINYCKKLSFVKNCLIINPEK